MTQASSSNYWISPTALTIALNALGDSDYVQCSVAGGSVIMCYMKGFDGLGYDNGHNYRRWTLRAYPTRFEQASGDYYDTSKTYNNGDYARHIEDETDLLYQCTADGTTGTWDSSKWAEVTDFSNKTAKYVYCAIPRDTSLTEAYICFPSEVIDIYGQNASQEQIGSTSYYYINLQGIISAPNDSGVREWAQAIVTGELSTDAAIDAGGSGSWYSYSSVDDVVTFLKNITFKDGFKFLSLVAQTLTAATATITKLIVGGATFVGKAVFDTTATDNDSTIVTPKYVDEFGNTLVGKYLRKDQDDETPYKLTMASAQVKGTTTFGTRFTQGVEGGQIDKNADAELKSLVLRESLTVPQINYNRVEVIAGNTWRSQGGGIFEKVWTDYDETGGDYANYGIARLKLEDDEIGMIHVGDKCQGVFHLNSGNDTETSDTHDGNFHFAGFKTIYFEVVKIFTTDDLETLEDSNFGGDVDISTEVEPYLEKQNNSIFCYRLRCDDDSTWTDTTHPQPQMNFAQYANSGATAEGSLRQFCAYDTPNYHLLLSGMTGWTYDSSNIQYIEGYLTGFSIDYVKDGVTGTKVLSGYGLAFGKAYMWGTIDQFDRSPSLISQQLYKKALTKDNVDNVTIDDIGTSTDTQATSEKPYLWAYWHYVYSDDTTKDSSVFLAANYGQPGTSIDIKGASAKHFSSLDEYNAATKTSGSTYLIDYGLTAIEETPEVSDSDSEISVASVADDTLSEEEVVEEVSSSASYIAVYPATPAVATEGYCYVNAEDGHLYVSKGSNGAWVDAGNIQGAGISVQYCSDEDFPEDLIHDTFQDGDVWMRTKLTSQTSWGTPVRIVGIQGPQGDAGVTVNVGSTDITFNQADTSKTAYVTVRLFDGDTQKSYGDWTCSTLGSNHKINDDLAWGFDTIDSGMTFRYKIVHITTNAVDVDVPFTVTYNSKEYVFHLNIKTIANGKRGTTFSIRKWATVDVDDAFYVENETEGILISDIVITDDSQKWLCKKDFTIADTTDVDNAQYTKSDATPGTGTYTSTLWTAFNNFNNVATNLLLAQKALIQNLITEQLECEKTVTDEQTSLTDHYKLYVGIDSDGDSYPKLIYNVYTTDSTGTVTSQYGYNTFGIDGAYFMSDTERYRSEITTTALNIKYCRTGYDPCGIFLKGIVYDNGNTSIPKIELVSVGGKTSTFSADGLDIDGDIEAGNISVQGITTSNDGTPYKGITKSVLCSAGYMNFMNGILYSITVDPEQDL